MNLSLGNFSLRDIRQRDWTIIIIVLTILAAVAWYYWMFAPTREAIQAQRIEIEQLEADIEVGRRARASLPQLEEDLAQAQRDRAAFLAQLPNESEVSQLIENLRVVASNSNVVLASIDQGSNASDDIQDVRALGFSLSTAGKFGQVMTFTNALENLERFTRVEQVDLSVSEDGIDNPDLNATYDFTVYVYTGEAEPTLSPDTEASR